LVVVEIQPIYIKTQRGRFDLFESLQVFEYKYNDIIVIYPRDPFEIAEKLKLKFLAELGKRVGIVIADSRLIPTRIGTTGVAIASAGFEPVEDQRGRRDLFGNVLRVTFKGVADALATMGVAVMGESDESTPAAVVRGANVIWSDKKFSWKDMAIESFQDIYLRGNLELISEK
jgi:F420-0:gamma-glutamyl ligase